MKYIEIDGIRLTTRTGHGYLLTTAPNTTSASGNFNKAEYTDTDGADYKEFFYNERSFNISGYILCDTERGYYELRRKLISSLSPKTHHKLVYYNGFEKFTADIIIDRGVTFGKVIKKTNSAFSIPVIIPDFYFNSGREFKKDVFKRESLVKGTFTLPCIFTQRTNRAEVYNYGDASAVPVFELICFGTSDGNIEIHNETTNEFLKLDYTPTEGEIITIDCKSFEAESSINGNIIKHITADSVFFDLPEGKSAVSCPTYGVSVKIKYFNRYAGV